MARHRIQTVAEQTGIPAATLRTWERRYGVPQPHRTSSAYRLYSDRDIERVRDMRRRIDAGSAASEAAQAVLNATVEPLDFDADADPQAVTIRRLVAAAESFDEERIQRDVQWALTQGSALEIFDRILTPALRRVGDLWHAGKVSIAQEHLFSSHVEHVVRDMVRAAGTHADRGSVLVACVANETHTLGLYGVALRMLTWGIRPMILGARTPPAAVHDAVQRTQPTLVALSMTAAVDEVEMHGLMRAYAEACGDTPWLMGGAASESARAAVEAAGGVVVGVEPEVLRRAVLQAERRTG